MSEKTDSLTNLKYAVLGYDPGGVEKNGAAIITVDKDIVISAKVTTMNSVEKVLNWFTERVDHSIEVKAAGIDTLLSWSTGIQGLRPVDQYLREKYPKVRQSVIASNGLYGAMVVQGMSMAMQMREKWKQIILNETHPKVQYYAQAKEPYKYGGGIIDWLRTKIDCADFPLISSEHEWDALYSAWVTLKAIQDKSIPDLLDITDSRASSLMLYPAGPVHYYWLA